jgi:hypothetical protein
MDVDKEDIIEKTVLTLPFELSNIIFNYLPTTSKVWLNKMYYLQHNNLIKSMIPENRFNNYVISIIRHDSAFSLEHIISENKSQWVTEWINSRHYRYNNKKYTCFLYFIYEYSIDCCSNKCREKIEQHATELIGPKWHKRNRASSFRTRWSN